MKKRTILSMTWVVLLLLFGEMALSGNPYKALNLHLPPTVSETDCIIDPYQYLEDFENVTLGELPPCWTDKSGTANSVSVAMPAGFTSQALRLYSGSAPQTLMAIMPKISGNPVSSVKMSVLVKTDNPQAILTIGVVSDTTNLSTFTEIDSILFSDTDWNTHTIYFDSYSGNGQFIAFRYISSSETTIYMDDLTLEEDSRCAVIQNLTVSHISGSSAMVNWSPGLTGNPTYYTLEYSERGANDWTTQDIYTGSSHTITGLEQITAYEIRVKAYCEAGDESEWTYLHFTTRCYDYEEKTIEAERTEYGGNLPFTPGNNYSYTQQLFKASELAGMNPEITGIAFQYFSDMTLARDIKVYLGHSPDTAFSSENPAWVPFDSLQLVFHGNISFHNREENYWFPIYFDHSFHYDMNSSLVVAVADSTGNFVQLIYGFRMDSTSYVSSVSNHRDYYIGPDNPQAPRSLLRFRNNTRFLSCAETSCSAPGIRIPGANGIITSTSADVTLIPARNENAWWVEYKKENDTLWQEWGEETSTEFTLTGLEANTPYMVRIKSICMPDSSDWNIAGFVTLCGTIATLPYIQNFDTVPTGRVPVCWTLHSNATITPYRSGVSADNSSSRPNSMKFYSPGSTFSMMALPALDYTVLPATISLTFNMRNNPDSYMIIGGMSDPDDMTTFVAVDTIRPVAYNVWRKYECIYDLHGMGSPYIAFKPQKASSIFVDDIVIDSVPACMTPDQVRLIPQSATDIEISWRARGSATSWNLEYGPAGFTLGTGTREPSVANPYTVTGLTAATNYDFYLQSNCNTNDTSEWIGPFTVSTLCTGKQIPYEELFDTPAGQHENFPLCWTRPGVYITGSEVYPRIVSNNFVSGTSSLRFISSGSTTSYAVTPLIEGEINQLQVALYLRKDSPNPSSMEVGIMETPYDTASFILVETLAPEEAGKWKRFVVSFEEMTGQDKYIAFRYMSSNSSISFYMDNVKINVLGTPADTYTIDVTSHEGGAITPGDTTVDEGSTVTFSITPDEGFRTSSILIDNEPVAISTTSHTFENIQENHSIEAHFIAICLPPTQLTTVTDTTSAVVSWSGTEDTDGWELHYKEEGEEEWISIECGDKCDQNSDTITSLTPGTSYVVRVRAICGTYTGGWSEEKTFTTESIPVDCTVPTDIVITPSVDEAIVTWSQEGTSDGWELQYKMVSDDNWTSRNCGTYCDTQQDTIPGLDPETIYELRIRNLCGDQYSEWSDTARFTTKPNSVSEIEKGSGFVLFPNPARDQIQLTITNQEIQMKGVSIYNMQGKLVYQKECTDTMLSISLQNFPAGTYIVYLQDEKTVYTKKFVKH